MTMTVGFACCGVVIIFLLVLLGKSCSREDGIRCELNRYQQMYRETAVDLARWQERSHAHEATVRQLRSNIEHLANPQ